MQKIKFKSAMRHIRMVLVKRSPEILTGLGIVGMVTTTVMAVKATPKALMLIKQEEEFEEEKLAFPEMAKAAWKCYIPSVLLGSVSVVCLIGASSVNFRRNAALATAYTLSESALKEYQEKVVETIGEKKEQTVRDAIAKDKLTQHPVETCEVIITGKSDTLCYDVLSGRYFKSDIEKLRKAENRLNRQLRDEMYMSLNDFYYEIGLNNTSLGDSLGWNVDEGLELLFSAQLASDGSPCLVIDYRPAPHYDFQK